jgi:hypothetical protein
MSSPKCGAENIQVTNRCFENMENLKYLEMALINQNFINKEVKSRMYSRNACCHPYEDRLSSLVLSRNANLIICRSIILPVVLYAWNLVSDIMERTLTAGVWEQGAEETTWTQEGRRKMHDHELYNLYSSIIIRGLKWRRMGWTRNVACMGENLIHAEFGWGNLKERTTRKTLA